MDVPITERREKISELFNKNDYRGLGELGIKMVGGAENHDCAAYTLNELGVNSNPETINVLLSLSRISNSVPGAIFYLKKDNKVVQHYGIYENDIVRSRWGINKPVFEHRIEDIPVEYGEFAEFAVIDDNVKYAFQEATQRHVTGGN
jgi:hypothetical protein